MTTPVPNDLLYRADSICSLILYRERRGLSEQSVIDLKHVVDELRDITEGIDRAARSAGGR